MYRYPGRLFWIHRHSRALIAAFACVLWLAPLATVAQTTGTIEGTVTDQSGAALPGVTVEIASPNLQGTRNMVTAADGRFRFPSVPPGAYSVTATLQDFGKTQKNATVTLDATATVNLSLALSTTAEVTVTGEAPLVDKTSTTTGTSYSARVIDKLPVGRNYAEIVFSQPGVQADFGETQGRSLAISIYGATSAENLFLIDWVNTTNVIKGFQGKDINGEFVQEVEVKTGGYQAEYGRNTGGVINVITKSGGNEFHGGVFGYYNDTGMRADMDDGKPENYATPQYSEQGAVQFGNYVYSKDVRQEYGFDLGGFAVKDKVWFFGAYDRVQVNQNVEPLDPQNPTTFGVEFPNSFVQNKYSGKITLNLFQGTSIVGSVFSDSQTQNGVITLGSPAQGFSFGLPPLSLVTTTYAGRRDTGGPDYGARLNQLFGSFGIFTFQYAQHSDRFHTIPSGYYLPRIRDYTVSPTGVSFSAYGGLGFVAGPTRNNESERQAYAGAFTAYVGNHEIKVGGDYQNDDTFGSNYFTGQSVISIRPCLQSGANICDLTPGTGAPFYDNGRTGSRHYAGPVYYQHNFLAAGTPSDFTVIRESPFNTPIKRYSGFIQDQWKVIPSLTVNLGVRYDTESYYGEDPVTGSFKAFSLTDQWSPRAGVTWDFVGDGTSKLYASVGRFYYAIPTDLTVRVFTTSSSVQVFNYSSTSQEQGSDTACSATVTTGCVPQHQFFQGGSASGEPVDPGTKASYQDEATLGVEKAFDPTFSVGLKGTYRTLGRTVEDRCDLNANIGPDCPACAPNSCALQNPGANTPAASGYYPTCNGSENPTDPTAGQCTTETNTGYALGPSRRYFRGIELTARKQFTNQIWAQASFLYSSLLGNYSGAISEATGQTDPGINADYDYYQLTFNAFGNLELDRPVQARIDAVYNAPFGLSAGLNFYVRSGLPISRLGWFNGGYFNSLYLDTRGSDGRTPTDYDMNVSVGYNWNVGAVTITPMLYVFNVLNRQTATSLDVTFNPNGSFVTTPGSPFYGQAGIEPGSADNCPATSPAPCTDNPDYRKVATRGNPRLLRAALKITF